MKDQSKKKQVLIQELSDLRQRIQDLEQSESGRRQTEEALRASEERYRSLASSVDSMYIVNRDCRYIFMNEQCQRRFGVPLKDIIGKRYHDFYSEENSETFAKTVEEVFETGKAIQMEHLSERDKCFFLRTFSPAMDQEGKSIAAVTIVSKNITERKQAEEALRESEERYRTILENIEDGYFEVDIAGNLTFFNDALCRLNEYPRTEMMGVNYRQYTDMENSQILYQTFNKIFRTGEPSKRVDYEIIGKDGTKRSVESAVSLIRNISGQPTGFRGIIRNITERKQAEIERERLITELQSAIEQIKTLRGIIPICANCKKIRDDKGYWQQVEAYVSRHTEAQFSHSVCPNCMKELYPEFCKDEETDLK
ncbi:MAG: PAS domain S-box protein [Syntrophaceae bacterium]